MYRRPASVVRVLASFRRHHPDGPVVLLGDGGDDFSALCAGLGRCVWRQFPHAFKPAGLYASNASVAIELASRFFGGLGDLAALGATHALLLEDDVRVLSRATQPFAGAAIYGLIAELRFPPPLVEALVRAGWDRAAARSRPYGGFGGCVLDVPFFTRPGSVASFARMARDIAAQSPDWRAWPSDALLTAFALSNPPGCKPLDDCGTLALFPESVNVIYHQRDFVRLALTGRVAVVHNFKGDYAEQPTADERAALGWLGNTQAAAGRSSVASVGRSWQTCWRESLQDPPMSSQTRVAQVMGALFFATEQRPAAAVRVLASFRRHCPEGHIGLLGDGGGFDFSRLCSSLGRCRWSPRKDAGPPSPAELVERIYAAFVSLAAAGMTHAVVLGDDVRVLRPFTIHFSDAITCAAANTAPIARPYVDLLVKAGRWDRTAAKTMPHRGFVGCVFDLMFWSQASISRAAAAALALRDEPEARKTPLEKVALDTADLSQLQIFSAVAWSHPPGCAVAAPGGCCGGVAGSFEVLDCLRERKHLVTRIASGGVAIATQYRAELNDAPSASELESLRGPPATDGAARGAKAPPAMSGATVREARRKIRPTPSPSRGGK